MASRPLEADDTAPLHVILSSVRTMPRPVLSRLVARMIDHLDELDGDADDEPEQDRCNAGDDEIVEGSSPALRAWGLKPCASEDEDSEPDCVAAFNRDQTPKPPVTYDQHW